jgi:hypothetical protein
MSELTIRNIDWTVERKIQNLAAKEKSSLNQAVLRLLRLGARAAIDSPGAAGVIGSSVDHLAGTWGAAEVALMADVERDFEQMDLKS